MPERIAVIGCGQFGTVLACHAARGGHAVVLWGRTDDEVDPLQRDRTSPRIEGLTLPQTLEVTRDARRAMDGADLVLTAIPAQYARSVWKVLVAHCPPTAIVVSVAKGFEMGSMLRPTEVLAEIGVGGERVALSGPTIATEVARGLPTALIAAGRPAAAQRVQRALTSDAWRIYCSTDQVGVEAAGAIKNVIALAAGMIDGMDLGMNAKATLLARGLAEISRLGIAMGGSRDTFFGIAGMGDLATTCFSADGRNRTFGEKIGRGESCESALRSMVSVVEGVDTCKVVAQLAARYQVEMPIAQAVHSVLFDAVDPRLALQVLMRRTSGEERI